LKIELNNGTYELCVKQTFIEDGVITEETISLDEWSEIVSKRSISTLFELEKTLSILFGREIHLNQEFRNIRKPLLNLSGSVRRLPENLVLVKRD
jgi:hypothetical protein